MYHIYDICEAYFRRKILKTVIKIIVENYFQNLKGIIS